MEAENWPIDFSFTYPVDCTREQLRKILTALSLHWPGWENYPWRITRNIHRLIDTPSVNFHYLLVQHCVASHAAHVVLKGKFADRNEVLDMMIREKFQFVGVFRLMLIDALRYEMRFTKLTYIRDCTGRDDGHTSVTEEELKARRERYRDTIEGAEHDFARILNIASVAETVDEMVNGRPVRVWARGGDLPAPVMLPVRSDFRDGKKVLWPAKQEAAAMVRAGKTVPCLELMAKTASALGGDKSDGSSRNGKGDGASTVSEVPERKLVGMALTLAQELDGNPRAKAPTHMMVLKMYCLDRLTVRDIQKKCRCGHGTVMNRKRILEKRLGQPLDSYRNMSGIFSGMVTTLEDGRAEEIYRKGLVD